MGVQGLTTFVDEHPHLLTDLQLHDTRVVIDGNNLFFFLHKLYGVSYAYGGDYNTYANSVGNYFKTLTSVGIQPFVVFDGCYDSDDRKLATILKRARDKICTSNLMSKGMNGNLIPLLTSVVFRDVLVNLGIPHVTCDGEADGEIATLANMWGCPVMSNDSDFYIYDLRNGFILFDYLNLQAKTEKDKNGKDYQYLHAQVYYLDNLLKSYNKLSRESIPLFATLMGNDFTDQKLFDTFFQKANVSCGRPQVSPRRHYKMAQLLKWMNKYKGDVLTKVLECIQKDEREKVKELIDFSVNNYLKVTADTSPRNLFDYKRDSDFETDWRSFHGNPFPEWFISACRDGQVFTHFINTLVLQKVIVPCQVEVAEWPSAMDCGLFLRQVVYSILYTLDIECRSDLSVTEYVREDGNLVKKVVPALRVTPNGVPIPHLKEVPSMDINKREEFLYQCLGVGTQNLADIPSHLSLFAALLIYFVQNVSPKVTRCFIYSIIICLIKISVVDRDFEGGGLSNFTLPDLHKAKERLKKYTKPVSHNHANPFNGEIVHSLSQLQSCFWAVLQLSQLLELPDKLPAPGLAISGSIIYHLYSDLKVRSDPLVYIQELLGGSTSTVKGFFDLITNNVMRNISDDTFQEQFARKSKKARRKAKRKQDQSHQHHHDVDSETAPSWGANCDLSNRFSQLMAGN